MVESKRRREVNHTKTGLLLLIIGSIVTLGIFSTFLIGPIGFVFIIGSFLNLVGVISIILGRHGFGPKHSRNMILSIILYAVAIVAGIITNIAFITSIFPAYLNRAQVSSAITANAVADAYMILFIGTLVYSSISGLAQVFLIYALQQLKGRIFLWTAYVAQVTTGILTTLTTLSGLANAAGQAVAAGRFNSAPVDSLQTQSSILRLAGLIPIVLLDIGAFYLAWSRIKRGEIPESITVTGTPTY